MINNNPYNIPEKPLKQSKIYIQNSPPFPHQINRRQEEIQYKTQQTVMLKRSSIPYSVENSVSQSNKVHITHLPMMKPQSLQMSNVTHWDPRQSGFQPVSFWELNDRFQSVSARLDSQERKLNFILETRKHEQSTNLSDSTSLSQQMFPPGTSKQLERYHSNDDSFEKIREEINSYFSRSQKLTEDLRSEILEQRESITQELISSFKQCLKDKFIEEQLKITECITNFSKNQQKKLIQLMKGLKEEINVLSESCKHKQLEYEQKSISSIVTIKQKVQQLALNFQNLHSDYRNFKQEVMDNILATQDHKKWLFQVDKQIQNLTNNHKHTAHVNRGTLKVSSQFNMKQPIHLIYEQYLSIAEKSKTKFIKSDERTYLIDDEGYLLDSNRFYIVDQNDNRIRLSTIQIQKLRSNGLLE